MKFCWIPAGEVLLGSPKAERQEVLKLFEKQKEPAWIAAEAEEVRGKFKTKGLWLAKFAVTQQEWETMMGNNPSYFSKQGERKDKVQGMDTSRFPGGQVSWDECQRFLKKLNDKVAFPPRGQRKKFALPHEDQWEYACRGGKGNEQAFYFGNRLIGKEANCDGTFPFGTTSKGPYLERTTEVRHYENEARHPWELCDMSGNVYQWCENKYDNQNNWRVLRGGSWNHTRSSAGQPAATASRE